MEPGEPRSDAGRSGGTAPEEEHGRSPAERTLLDAALEFYGAASTVIEYRGPARPHLRPDAAGLRAVRDAMSVLERHILAAHRVGIAPEGIARITRLEPEIVELILQRGRAAEPDPARAD